MTDRKQFTFYESFYEAIACLPDKEDRADAYEAIAGYALYGEEPNMEEISPFAKAVFILIKPTLDSSRVKAEAGKLKGKGKTHGTPCSESKTEAPFGFASPNVISKQEANKKQTGSKTETERKQSGSTTEANCKQNGSRMGSNRKQTGNDIEIEIDIDKESTPPIPPSFREFYIAYPRKTGPTRAEAVWQSLLGQGVLPPMGVILSALEQQKKSQQWQKEGGRFIPAPAKWLSEHRWNDKLPAAGTPAQVKPDEIAKQAVARMMASAEQEAGNA